MLRIRPLGIVLAHQMVRNYDFDGYKSIYIRNHHNHNIHCSNYLLFEQVDGEKR